MIASTFWKNTIPLCTGCDQSTACSSLWWSAKLPAVWKNFFGTIGARSRTSASGSRSPVSPTWPPRSNHSRVEAQSSSTTSSPSRRPTRPASNVTSFIASTNSHSMKVTFMQSLECQESVSNPEISAQVVSTAGRSSRTIRCEDQSRAWTARLTPASTRPSGPVIGAATDRSP